MRGGWRERGEERAMEREKRGMSERKEGEKMGTERVREKKNDREKV